MEAQAKRGHCHGSSVRVKWRGECVWSCQVACRVCSRCVLLACLPPRGGARHEARHAIHIFDNISASTRHLSAGCPKMIITKTHPCALHGVLQDCTLRSAFGGGAGMARCTPVPPHLLCAVTCSENSSKQVLPFSDSKQVPLPPAWPACAHGRAAQKSMLTAGMTCPNGSQCSLPLLVCEARVGVPWPLVEKKLLVASDEQLNYFFSVHAKAVARSNF